MYFISLYTIFTISLTYASLHNYCPSVPETLEIGLYMRKLAGTVRVFYCPRTVPAGTEVSQDFCELEHTFADFVENHRFLADFVVFQYVRYAAVYYCFSGFWRFSIQSYPQRLWITFLWDSLGHFWDTSGTLLKTYCPRLIYLGYISKKPLLCTQKPPAEGGSDKGFERVSDGPRYGRLLPVAGDSQTASLE